MRAGSMRRAKRGRTVLDEDNAFIALSIAAMDASGHVSAEEAARAHDILWSTRRFRQRSGDAVGRRIATVQTLIEKHGAQAIIHAAARAIPKRLRSTVYAVAADIVLVDGRLERLERRFLTGLADDLGLDPNRAKNILDVVRLKNSA